MPGPCPPCGGSGILKCLTCRGRGRVTDRKGDRPCSACNGRGSNTCGTCGGTGRRPG
jgi:hypothetical protein